MKTVKVLICGSRDWTDQAHIADTLAALVREHGTDMHVIHGACRGADRLAGACAADLGLEVTPFPAEWRVHGVFNRKAGFERNRLMLDEEPDLVVAFQLHHSSGTQDTINEARRRRIPTLVLSDREEALRLFNAPV